MREGSWCDSPSDRKSQREYRLTMAPVQFKLQSLLKKKEYECYREIDETTVFCTVCDKQIRARDNGRENSSLGYHVKTKKHVERAKNSSGITPSIAQVIGKRKDDFNYHLVKAFIQSGIPLFKLSHPSMNYLFNNLLGKHVFDRRYLTDKYIPILYNECLVEIRASVADHFVYFMLDETPDAKQRCVVNVLVGVLNGRSSRPYLLLMRHFDHSVNAQIVTQVFVEALQLLWPSGIQYSKIQLIITDAASYRVLHLAMNKRKLEFYSNILAMNRFKVLNWFTWELMNHPAPPLPCCHDQARCVNW